MTSLGSAAFGPGRSGRNLRGRVASGLHGVKRTVRSVVDRAADRYYPAAKAYHLTRLRRQDRGAKAPKLLVYQMGKVGSRSIERSLADALPEADVYHVHVLTRQGIERLETLAREHPDRGRPPAHLWASLHLRRLVDRGFHRRNWRVVTLVRDPIARNVSSFFQVLQTELGYDYEARARELWPDELMEELRSLFWNAWPFHDRPLTYFDEELRSVFGVDVYATPFPTEQGYQVLRGGEVDVLLLKLERLTENARVAFHEFLGLDDFQVEAANTGEAKPYAETYRQFLSELRVPADYLDRMYGSRYATHFYSPAELASFRRRWGSAIPPVEVR